MSLARDRRWNRMSIGGRVTSVHLEHFCPGGVGVPVTGSGPIGLGAPDQFPAGAAGNAARARGQSCGRCGQPIRPAQDARRRADRSWVHESCDATPH